jgi:hypothetical protein
MPASSFNIQAPNSDSSAPASSIHGLDKSGTTSGDIGTLMSLPAQDFSVTTAHKTDYHGEVNE